MVKFESPIKKYHWMRIFTLECLPLSSHTLNKIKPNNHGTKKLPLISPDLQSHSLQSSMADFGSRIIQIMSITHIYIHTYNNLETKYKTKGLHSFLEYSSQFRALTVVTD